MGIFAKLKSNSENNYLMSPKSAEKDKLIEFNMSTKDESTEEREEGEIVDEFEDIISSDEEFSMRKRIEELEAKNAELEKIAKISVSAAYASGGYNDYPKKDSHHLDRYPPVLIDISDDEDYPPAPKIPRIQKRRKSIQHSSSSRHKLLHTSSSSHRRRKHSSSPPPAPSYRQSDKLLLSLFHERVVSHSSHSSKRKRKTKKQHSTKSFRGKSRENYVSDSGEDEYSYLESYNANDNHEHLNSSDRDKSYSLNRDELRVALARNTHRIEQHASLKDRLTRKKENRDKVNFVLTVDLDSPSQEAPEASEARETAEAGETGEAGGSGEAVIVEKEEQKEKPSSSPLPVEEKEQTDDNLEEQELRILALKSAVLKKHMVRKKRNENVAYSPSDFDEIYKCISESPSLNNIDTEEACNSMEISPVPSPKMVLSDDGGIDTKPVDMDIVNSDSECELPLPCDKWIPIEQIPLPNSIGFNDQIYNPTPMRYNNNNYIEETHVMPPDVRYESSSISPKNFDSEVDEEEIALRALLLAKMNTPKVNKIAKKEPLKVVHVQSPDPDVSLEAETLRNFLINNMKKKAKPKNSSASVLKEAVRRLTGKNAPTEEPVQNRCLKKSTDQTDKELSQAIIDMANVNIGLESKVDMVNNGSSSGRIRVKNIDTLIAPQKFEINSDVQRSYSEQENSKENPVVQIHQKVNASEKNLQNKPNAIKLANKEALPATQTAIKNVLKSVSSQNNQKENFSKPFCRSLTVKIEKMILPKTSMNKNVPLKPSLGTKIAADKGSENVDCIDIKAAAISGDLPNQLSCTHVENPEEIADKVNSKTYLKTEQECSESNSKKELSPKAGMNQKNIDAEDAQDTPALNEVSSLDPATGIFNDVDSNPVKEKSSKTENSVNEKGKESASGPLVEIEQQNTITNIAVNSENATTNVKELNNSEATSDEKISSKIELENVEHDEKKDSSNNHQSEDTGKNDSSDKVSRMPATNNLVDANPIEKVIVKASPCKEEVNVQKLTKCEEIKSIERISTVDIIQKSKVKKDESIKSILTSKVEVKVKVSNEKATPAGPRAKTIESTSSKKILSAQNRQVKLGAKSIELQVQGIKTVNANNQIPLVTQNVYKLTNIQKITEPEITVIKNSLPTQNKIIPTTFNAITQKPIAKPSLPNQQLITTRTKIVKPNKIINQQTIDLKRKNIDNLPQLVVSTKKPKPDDTNRLITTAEIPKVPDLVIQVRVSESESEYSDFSTHDMGDDENSRVCNIFNRSTLGNEYLDIASPISLPMESPCDTPTRSRSPIVISQTQTHTPQPSVEKSIVNDYFEAKLEQFLKNVRSKVSDTVTPPTKSTEGKAPVNSTPVAVRHLPEASQQEYRRLINRMKMLERQKQAKNLQELAKPIDSGVSDLKTTITDDGDTKFLVRKVLVKNASAKPKIPEKTEATIEKSSSPSKSVESPEKSVSSVSPDGKSVKSARQNLLVLYEDSYRKTGTSIICNLDKSIELVMVAKNAKMAKLKCEKRLRELRKEMEEVQKNLKEQQEKITKIYPEICNSHQAIESLKTRRLKINKAVTALGKSVIGSNYSMRNDQKFLISEKSKKLAADIKFVNSMKLSDVEKIEDQNRLNLSHNAKQIIAPVKNTKSSINYEKLPTTSSSVAPFENNETSLETQKSEANSMPEEELPAHKNDLPSMPPSSSPPSSSTLSAIIKNEVPTCESQSPKNLNKSVPENMENHIMNNTIVPEILSKNDEERACSPTTNNGHEEALELEQPVVAVDGDNINNNEQALEQIKNMDDIVEEENGGEQVGSAKLQDYVSPLSHLRDERHINPNGVVCPYQLMGQCDDKDCNYMHLED